MSKSFIIILLIFSVLLQGCHSYYTRTEEERMESRPAENEPVMILLTDGSQIESDAYHHINVVEADDFIYVIGEQVTKTGLRGPFQGKLRRSLIDSSTTEWVDRKQYFVCRLSDSSYVRFAESDYVVITPDLGTGFWCVGTLRLQLNESQFKGKVPTEKIQEFQIEKFSWTKTIILILGIAVTPGIFVAFLAAGFSSI